MTTVNVIRLLEGGVSRVLNGMVGLTFLVESFTEGVSGPVAHVRDYRYRSEPSTYQIWSLAADQYELLPYHETDADAQMVREASASVGVHRNLAAADIADRLRPAFEAVQNAENWKYPVDAFVEAHKLADTIVAIEFFTGGKTTVSWDGGRRAFHITSPGYYNCVGA
jgi:hypothetical protein